MATFVAPAAGAYKLGEACGEDPEVRVVVDSAGNICWGGGACWTKHMDGNGNVWYTTSEGWLVTFLLKSSAPLIYTIAIVKPGPGNDVECEMVPV